MKTHVPKELMKEGWQTRKSDKEIKNSWTAERDVFTWLSQGYSIEDTIERYKEYLKDEPPSKGKIKGIFQPLIWGNCHHGINTFIKRCPTCDKQHEECIEYLQNLLLEVKKYNQQKLGDSLRGEIEKNIIEFARILEISGKITEEKIKEHYRKLASQYHPDKVNNLGIELRELADKKMKELNKAREYLINHLYNN